MASGQQFPENVTQILELYYARGMRGWGKRHTADILSASNATGLKQAQIEVRVLFRPKESGNMTAADATWVILTAYYPSSQVLHVSHSH